MSAVPYTLETFPYRRSSLWVELTDDRRNFLVTGFYQQKVGWNSDGPFVICLNGTEYTATYLFECARWLDEDGSGAKSTMFGHFVK